MSIFRNRPTQRSQRSYEEERDNGPPEPRLFTARQQPANNWRKEEEEPSPYQEDGDYYRAQEGPQWQEPRNNRVEDLHPRELSFWREERLYEDYNQGMRQSSPFRFILVTASVLVIATFSWLAFRWISAPHSEAPPLIYADPTPYKVRPDHPGGLQVPYQDRLVYNRLSPESQQPVERLLPQTEQPIAASPPQQQQYAYGPQPTDPQQQSAYGYEQQYPQQQQMAPGYAQQQPMQQMAPGYGQQPQQAPYPQQQQMPPQQQPTSGYAQQQYAYPPQPPIHHQQQMANGQMGAQGMAANPATQQQLAPPQKPTASAIDEIIDGELTPEAKAKSTQKPKTAALPTNAYRIQIATLATEDAAKKELERIRRAHPDLMGKLTSAIQKVEGEAGVARILFGPFANREAAIKQCTKCRTRGFSCIVLNPS